MTSSNLKAIALPFEPGADDPGGMQDPMEVASNISAECLGKFEALIVCTLETDTARDVFRLVKLTDLIGEPEMKVTMTTKERCRILLLNVGGDSLPCRIFAKVERGVGWRVARYCTDKVSAAYKYLRLTSPMSRHIDKYFELAARFDQDLWRGYNYPDSGKGETLELFDWKSRYGHALLEYLPQQDMWPDVPRQTRQSVQAGVKAEDDELTATGSKKRTNVSDSDSSVIQKRPRKMHGRKQKPTSNDESSIYLEDSEAAPGRPGTPPSVGLVVQEDIDSPDSSFAMSETEVQVRRRKKKFKVKNKCCPNCKCWQQLTGADSVMEVYNESLSATQQRHHNLIFTYLSSTHNNKRMSAFQKSLRETKDEMKSQRELLKEVADYSKIAAEEKQRNQERENDLEKLEYKYRTFYELSYHLEHHEDEMRRSLQYTSYNPNNGNGFLQSALKKVMSTSLLYRMYSCDATSCVRTNSGRMFIYGTEYFRMPEKFQEMLTEYLNDRWPHHWPRRDIRKKFLSILQQHRKTRGFQMKNLFMKLAKKRDCHPLVRALWWDHYLETKIFDRPAPVWSNDDSEKDEYLQRYMKEWEAAVAKKISADTDWRTQEPPYKDDVTQEKEKDSVAERSLVADEAVPEPKWQYED